MMFGILCVQMKNGKPTGNPMDKFSAHFLGEKLGEEMGEDGLPKSFGKFRNQPMPPDPFSWKRYHVQSTTYEKVGEYWCKPWDIKTFTAKEQKAIKAQATAKIIDELGYKSWKWDEEQGRYLPPVASPEGPYWWDETAQEWYLAKYNPETGQHDRIEE